MLRALTPLAAIALVMTVGCKKDDAGTGAGTAPTAGPAGPAGPKQSQGAIEIGKTSADLASPDPSATYWDTAKPYDVLVKPQQELAPSLKKATVDKLAVKALTDGKRVSFLLTWTDETLDGNVDVSRFTDGIAMEFPLHAEASPQMGSPGMPVQVLSWKALWQKDVDVAFQDVQHLHPNFWSDLYWFAEGGHPWPVPGAFESEHAKQWFVALSAGNPVAAWGRKTPAIELVSEGPGTLTHQPESETTAKGAWKDKQWKVVFTRPLETADPNDFQFELGGKGRTAFAVWNGSGGNVGARKHWSTNWIAFEVAK